MRWAWRVWVYDGMLLVSAGAFAVSSALAKVAIWAGVSPPAITFWRFFIGWAGLLVFVGIVRPEWRVRNVPSLVLRGVLNVAAVFLFYSAIKYTTIANANLLNLTYPLFVALLGWVLLGESLVGRDWTVLAGAGVGVYLVVNPHFGGVNVGDVLGLACGLAAGFAVVALRWARQANRTVTVLLFLLTTGVVLTWPALLGEDFSAYSGRTWGVVIGCGVSGVVGQFAITLAFRHVRAFAGSVLGMSRVVIAAAMGTVWLGEALTWRTVVGGGVLMGSILLLSGGRRGGD